MSVFNDPELDELLKKAQALFDAMTPDEKVQHRREQVIDFAWGNLACSTNHQVPRELVEKIYDEMHPRKIMRTKVYVESPLAGDVEANVHYLKQCLRECVLRGEAPFASHAFYTLFLDDLVPEERAAGIESGLAWARGADKTVVYVDRGVSPGMILGIDRAQAEGRVTEYRRLGQTEPLGSFDPRKP